MSFKECEACEMVRDAGDRAECTECAQDRIDRDVDRYREQLWEREEAYELQK